MQTSKEGIQTPGRVGANAGRKGKRRYAGPKDRDTCESPEERHRFRRVNTQNPERDTHVPRERDTRTRKRRRANPEGGAKSSRKSAYNQESTEKKARILPQKHHILPQKTLLKEKVRTFADQTGKTRQTSGTFD